MGFRRLASLALIVLVAGCDSGPTGDPGGVAPTTSGGPAWIRGTQDERFATVERHLRGFDLAMVETGHRYGELHAAGQDRNWAYALYQAGKIRTAIHNGVERRPARAASARSIEAPLAAVAQAARSEDPAAFDAAFSRLTTTCNDCHVAERVAFIHVAPAIRTSVVRPPRTAATTVFVVRHAQALKNVAHPPGLSDAELDVLTPTGRAQAAALARQLASRGVEVVVASPTGRTRETAAAIAHATGVAAVETSALAALRGTRTPAGAKVTWEWRLAEWSAGRDPRPEDGESLADGVGRAVAAVEALARPGGVLVLVTHGDIGPGLIGDAAGTPVPERAARHDMPEGSVAELLRVDGRWMLIRPATRPD